MRKLNLISGALGLAALALTACSNEMPVQEPQVAEIDETRFMTIQISAPSDLLTRAFENGSSNESYIDRLDFFFYDAAGRPTSQPVSMDLDSISSMVEHNTAYFPEPNESGNNITRVFTSVVPAALTQGQNLPTQVICIVNGEGDAITSLKNVTLEQLIDKVRTTFRTGSYFTMSNSVYYGKNDLNGLDNQRLCATPININSQLFGTREEALKAVTDSQDDDVTNDNALVDIYVERLAAKIGLTMGTGDEVLIPYTLKDANGTDVTLRFVPNYWTINASDKYVYLTKRYGIETTPSTVDAEGNVIPAVINRTPTWRDIAITLTGSETNSWWNDPDRHRSYWGSSPSYFADEYPDVSDDVNDLDGYTHDYGINYWSYNNIATQAARPSNSTGTNSAGVAGIGKQALAWSETNGFTLGNGNATLGTTPVTTSTGYIYTFETTASRYRIQDIQNSNPAAVVASAVVVGKYTVNGEAVPQNGAFYIDRNAGTKGIYYPSTAAVKTVLAGRQRVLFSNNDGSGRLTADNPCLVIKHPDLAVRKIAGTKLAGRLVTLQLSDQVNYETNVIWFYQLDEEGSGEYVRVLSDNLDEVNAQLLTVGYMDMFAQGLGFYSVPIRHLNWNDDLYSDGTYDWAAMPSGALGVVRNHVYNLNIRKIEGLASALRSADQPIVPAKEEANQYIAARLNVLAWNIVNSWTVDL
ncbi:MAG: fimbria major subunit [Muribaculaceae bacterium]|nr:fimbria major subunit [Muribaculaceae bacterium]